VFVDNVLLYYAEAQNYRSCGDTANYRATIELIRANLDSSGCECACCDDNVYYWVSNNSATSIIESIIESFQFRLFTLTPAAAGPPPTTANVTAGVQVGAIWENTTTNILYLCTNNTAPTPTWVEFYNYQAAVAASVVSTTVGTNLTAVTVQGQLNQADALFTVIDGEITSLQNTALTTVAVDGITITGDGTVGNPLIAVAALPSVPLVFAARILSTGSVSFVQMANNTAGTISISQSIVTPGIYTITSSNAAFIGSSNTIVLVTLADGQSGIVGARVNNASTITVETLDLTGAYLDLIDDAMIKIEIY
jgi:hypothetical protein